MGHSSHKHQRHRAAKAEGQDWSHQPLPAELARQQGIALEGEHPGATLASPKAESIDEATLVDRIVAGERAARQLFYRRYAPTVLKRLLRIFGGDMAQAEDCLQQTFLKAFEKIGQFRGENSLLAWLYRISSHAAMDLFRKHQARARLVQKLGSLWPFGGSGQSHQQIPEHLFLEEERKATLHRGLATLGEKKRMAVLLCDLEGYTIEEAAQELGIPVGTLASRLFRGRQELRVWLQREFRESGLAPLTSEDWSHE